MFDKIIVAEDFQDTQSGIVDMLKNELEIPQIQEELYCDHAFNRLKVAHAQGEPFELLITDLSFKKDHVEQKLRSGQDLIRAAREIQPDLKIIVNSMEDNPTLINSLFKELNINAYVCKGRQGLSELVKAIQEVNHNRTFVSPQINLNVLDNVIELDEFDIMILQDLAEGYTKKEISERLKEKGITPNSESTIDKRISKLFDEFEVKNATQLLATLIRTDRI